MSLLELSPEVSVGQEWPLHERMLEAWYAEAYADFRAFADGDTQHFERQFPIVDEMEGRLEDLTVWQRRFLGFIAMVDAASSPHDQDQLITPLGVRLDLEYITDPTSEAPIHMIMTGHRLDDDPSDSA